MHTIADQLCMAFVRIPDCTDHTGISVGERRHGVIQMRCMRSAALDGFLCRIIIRRGMRNGNDRFVLGFLNKFHGSRLFRRKIHKLDQALCRTLQLTEEIIVTVQNILCCLCPLLRGADEGSLHIDADKMRAAVIFVISGVLHDPPELLFGNRHRSRADRGHTDGGFILRDDIKSLFGSVAHVCTHTAVEMNVHKPRDHIQAFCIQNLSVLFLPIRGICKSAVCNCSIPLCESVFCCKNICILNDHDFCP